MSSVGSLKQQLKQAQQRRQELEQGAKRLSLNLDEQQRALDQMRRAARNDGASFEDVVQQQTRYEAASGLLEQQQQELAECLDLIEELETAQADEEQQTTGRQKWAACQQTVTAFHEYADALEACISAELELLAELRASYPPQARTVVFAVLDRGSAMVGMERTQFASDALRAPKYRKEWDTVEVPVQDKKGQPLMEGGQPVTMTKRGEQRRVPIPLEERGAAAMALQRAAEDIAGADGAAAALELVEQHVNGVGIRGLRPVGRRVAELMG